MYNQMVNVMYEDLFKNCQSIRNQNKVYKWACVAIDIEQFHLFNDVFGRDKGNQVLESISLVLSSLPFVSIYSYLGNDNFFLFMEYNFKRIEMVCDELIQETQKITHSLGFRPALGVYCLDVKEIINMESYEKAKIACKEAKQSRKARFCIYNPLIHENHTRETRILRELKEAMDNGEVTFFLQPQCRISTNKIIGAEALARWVKKDGSIISPSHFIPVLEKNGFIADFDCIIWEKVCAWLSSLLDRGLEPVPISMNVSQMDILTIDVDAYISNLCDRYRIPHRLVKIEITETSFAEEYDLVKNLVNRLKASGFMVMMDDFGSGYSSLNMLERISVDVLKLDMGFLNKGSTNSRKSVTIIESIINMAKMMGTPMIVEGVEDQEQVDFLHNLGCRYAQGFYYYRPIPVWQFEHLIQQDYMDYRGLENKRNEQVHVREFLDENTFTDAMLNNILGAVAFYSLDGEDLTITRFNEQFYKAIGDPSMEHRQVAIQNYIVKEDRENVYSALKYANTHLTEGGICEARFYKSDGGVFWFKLHFFYLKHEQEKRIYYGQVEDVTEIREQSFQFMETLRGQSDIAMMMNLDKGRVQYVNREYTLSQVGLPSIDLKTSITLTAQKRFDDSNERRRFMEFFDVARLKDSHQHAKYHESIVLNFKLSNEEEPVEFSTYYIRWSKDQDLVMYVFVKKIGEKR